MESLFPHLLFLGPFFGPLILRIAIALIFAWDAWIFSKGALDMKLHALWALVLALLFVVGLFTQLAALAGIVYALVAVRMKKERSVFAHTPTVILTIATLLTLVITGAGYTPFPFGDLPY